MFVSPPFIHGKSRVRKRARTDLCGGRSAMVVPTATSIRFSRWGSEARWRKRRLDLLERHIFVEEFASRWHPNQSFGGKDRRLYFLTYFVTPLSCASAV